jgi:hypothetical protein
LFFGAEATSRIDPIKTSTDAAVDFVDGAIASVGDSGPEVVPLQAASRNPRANVIVPVAGSINSPAAFLVDDQMLD